MKIFFLRVLAFFLLTYNASFAQYNGGSGGGAIQDTINYNYCTQLPISYYVYFGGNGDGGCMDMTNYNSCSQTPLSYYVYFGGNGDGEIIDTVNYNTCNQTPLSYYAYFGGVGGGESADNANYTSCTQIPPAYYAYFGGNGDGYSWNQYNQCVYFPPIANFSASDSTTCTGQTVLFTDNSLNTPTAWQWSFPGGTPSTSNSSSPSVTYNTQGTYDVTLIVINSIGADTLVKTAYINVATTPPVPTITPNGSTLFCQGGNVILTSSASAENLWSNGDTTQAITINSSGSYTVTVTNGGCTATSAPVPVTVNNAVPPTPSVITGNTTVCSGSSNTYSIATVSDATSYTWTLPSGWTGSSSTTSIATVSGVASGIISVTANNTCGSSSAQTISVTIPIIDTTVLDFGGILTANAFADAYQWINCNGNIAITGETNQSFIPTAPGNYAVVITINGCSDTSACYNINSTNIRETETLLKSIEIMPNPSGGNFIIKTDAGFKNCAFGIYNILGEKVYQSTFNSQLTNEVNISDAPKGIYFLKVNDGKKMYNQKIIIDCGGGSWQ